MRQTFPASGRALTVALALSLAQIEQAFESRADDAEALRDFCAIVPGPLGRIIEFWATPQSKASVAVDRGPWTFNVPKGCYLHGGDIVRAGPATSVKVLRPDGRIVTGDFSHPLVMPVVRTGLSNEFWSLVQEWAGGDLSGARARAQTPLVGATRGDEESPIVIRGLFEVGMQRVVHSRPLEVQWEGGSFPFTIELEGPRGTALRPIRGSAPLERVFRVDFQSRPVGEYRLIITCCGGEVARFLDFLVVPATEVPAAPLSQINDQRARDLAQALWLLTKAPSDWRLEALSRLALLAKDQHDPIAISILEESSNGPEE
jgi:hypothetical protein